MKFGRDYIIPTPFDPRLILVHPSFHRSSRHGHRGGPKAYRRQWTFTAPPWLKGSNPAAAFLQKISGAVLGGPKKRIVFAEGEEPSVIRAALAFQNQGLGKALLCGREELVRTNMRELGVDFAESKLEIINARLSDQNPDYVELLYHRLQRSGLFKAGRAAADQPGPQLVSLRPWWRSATRTAWSPGSPAISTWPWKRCSG